MNSLQLATSTFLREVTTAFKNASSTSVEGLVSPFDSNSESAVWSDKQKAMHQYELASHLEKLAKSLVKQSIVDLKVQGVIGDYSDAPLETDQILFSGSMADVIVSTGKAQSRFNKDAAKALVIAVGVSNEKVEEIYNKATKEIAPKRSLKVIPKTSEY